MVLHARGVAHCESWLVSLCIRSLLDLRRAVRVSKRQQLNGSRRNGLTVSAVGGEGAVGCVHSISPAFKIVKARRVLGGHSAATPRLSASAWP
jgi:hypothetical protein